MDEASRAAGAPRWWSVGALLLALGDAVAARFSACSVQGELAGFSRAPSGHCYFTLKDSDGAAAQLRCAMFRRTAQLLDFAPRDGQQVQLRGRLALYEARGELQLVVESMRLAGAGALYEQFLRMKARLEAEGLFDPARKRALPRWPRRVGIVTSSAAAALRDIVAVFARRAPHVELILYPSPVQGAEAPEALAAALAQAARRGEVEVLIVARGGGALEDLWAFNDERVVRAIAASSLPVISGVGHESDVTLADFAADLRAATPTAAAELATSRREDELERLAAAAQQMRRLAWRRIDAEAQRLDRCALRLARPAQALHDRARQLQGLQVRLRAALQRRLALAAEAPQRLGWRLVGARRACDIAAAHRLALLQARLAAVDPGRALQRGYVLVRDAAGRPLTSARDASPTLAVRLEWHDGTAAATIDRLLAGDASVRKAPGPVSGPGAAQRRKPRRS